MELMTLCRSCMVEVASWELQNLDGNAVEMFTFCTNVEVSGDDKLPKQFCCDCKIKIESSYKFIKKAQEVDVILKNILSTSETSAIVKSESLKNDLQYSESNSLEPDSGFSFEVKIDKNKSEEKLLSPNSNQSVEYKMEFDIYQTSPDNSENELDESFSNKEFDLYDLKLKANKDNFNKHSDRINDDDPNIVQKTIISKIDSNCTNHNKGRKKKKDIKRQKEAPELEMSLRRKTYNTRTRIHKSNEFKTEKGNEESNEEENYFKCDICKQRYKHEKVLLKHIKNKHSKTRKKKDEVQEIKGDNTHPVVKKCDICSRTFISNLWFTRHMKEHSDLDTKRYFCKHCPKTFWSYHAYDYHNKKHAESRSFACGECGARFAMGKKLAAHALAEKHACPHVCTKCGMAFKTKSILDSHMNSHMNEKPFLCGMCGFSAKLLNTLNTHMMTHTGEKPYSCKECPFRTTTPNNLQRHVLRHRGDRRRHACQHCGKLFYELHSVAKHIRQFHTHECPFQCYLCPQAFTDGWKCKLHIKRAHHIPFEEIPRISKNRTPNKETVSQTA